MYVYDQLRRLFLPALPFHRRVEKGAWRMQIIIYMHPIYIYICIYLSMSMAEFDGSFFRPVPSTADFKRVRVVYIHLSSHLYLYMHLCIYVCLYVYGRGLTLDMIYDIHVYIYIYVRTYVSI